MDESENRKRTADEQLTLMEKSFQMASRYMPATPETAAAPKVSDVGLAGGNGDANTAGQTRALPVGGVRERVVSALPQEMSDAEFIEACGQPRNMGFYTAAGEMRNDRKNTLAAGVHADQVVMDGQNVRLRLAEAMQAGGRLIPRGTILSGTARIQGERLAIQIRSLEYMASIIPLDLSVYDADGQPGVFIPDLQEVNAAKEILANMGANAGTSINLSSDAGEQFAADMGRDLIRGVSQFASKKLREVKVYLKAGYRVFLVSESSLKNESH
jgi:conjugative transposon TraM protein